MKNSNEDIIKYILFQNKRLWWQCDNISVLTRVCLSVCPHPGGRYPGQVQMGSGGTPARGVPHLRYPPSNLASGVPLLGVPQIEYPPSELARGVPLPGGYPTSGIPCQTWMGGTPATGYPIRPGWGYPCWGVPHLRYSHQTWLGVPLLGVPHLRYPPSDLAGGTPAGGYPTSGNRWSTWYAAVSMPLAFTQEDIPVQWMSQKKNEKISYLTCWRQTAIHPECFRCGQ